MNSKHPNEPMRQLPLWDDAADDSPNIQRDDSDRASIEQSALNEDHALMEEIVDESSSTWLGRESKPIVVPLDLMESR